MAVCSSLYLTRGHTNSFSLSPDLTRDTSRHFWGCHLRSSFAMDLISIPECARNRNFGTVIVKIRMEEQTGCCGDQGRPAGSPAVDKHLATGCERCNRTRLISKHNSDCDSVVEKCRPYRSSTGRSRYVNVCAAVCLLLLVGGLSPLSSAAPHRSRTMDRQRRQTAENRLWANPCDYDDSGSESAPSPKDVKEIASKLVAQAKNALAATAKYKDTFAMELHSYSSFDALVRVWDTYDWLRKFSWFRDEVLPKEKALYAKVSDEYMDTLMTKMDDVLPSMYKGLKMVVAGLYAFSNQGLNDDIISDGTLKEKINQTMHDVRAVLCYFSDIMKARKLEIMPLPDSEVPEFTQEDKLSMGLLLYRDTLNYLEYLAQVFQKFSEQG